MFAGEQRAGAAAMLMAGEHLRAHSEQDNGVPVPHVAKEPLGVTKDAPQERISEWTALRAPKRRNRQLKRHRQQSVSDSEDELGAGLRWINLSFLS